MVSSDGQLHAKADQNYDHKALDLDMHYKTLGTRSHDTQGYNITAK